MAEKSKRNPIYKPENVEEVKLTEEEREQRGNDVTMLCQMRDERDRQHPELDGMTYLQYYESNRKKDLSYLPPKRNKQDVRITSGITREKDTTLLSTMLNMNFVPDITAFDKDDLMVQELGDNMADLVKKSREIEVWDKKRPIIYRELISQGDVFVMELKADEFREMPLNKVSWDPESDNISDFNIKRRLKKIFSGCECKMIDGRKVYLGSTKIEYIEDQDVVALYDVISRKKAYSKYAMFERWNNVPTTVDTVLPFTEGNTYQTWNMTTLGSGTDQVGEVILMDVKGNRLQIYLNGVPMLPKDYPLTEIAPSGEIPIAQGKFEPISGFAYSKSQPAKIRVDQEVHDEVTKLMIEGMRLGRKAPMGSKKGKVISPSVLVAGKITPDMQEGDLFPLLENAGLNPADFSFYQLVKQSIDDKSVNDSFQGTVEGDPTATQINSEKEQQMLKLGLALDGVINLERRMTWNRLYDILQNWTQKYDPDLGAVQEAITGKYRSFTVNTTLEQGQSGVKMFRFTDDMYPPLGEQQQEESKLSKKYGKPVRVVYMNPTMLRKMKYTWFIMITPTPKSNDVLSQILFVDNMRKSIELFGPESHNVEYLKQRFAVLINEDYSKWFKKMDIMEMLNRGLETDEVQNSLASQMANGMKGGNQAAGGKRKQPLKAAIQ